MKKAKYIIGILIALAIIGVAVLLLRFYPVYAGAEFLQDNLEFEELSYDITVTLEKEKLTENQQLLVQTLATITGISQDNLLQLEIKGQVEDDIVYAQIIPVATSKPLTEFYLGKENDVMNVRMLYDAICDYFSEQSGIFALLLPEWKGGEYITIEQLEQLFSLDLSSVKEFKITSLEEDPSTLKYFGMLVAMEHEKSAEGMENFSFEKDGAKIQFQFNRKQEDSILSITCDVPKLQETLLELDNLIKGENSTESFSQNKTLQNIQSLQADITMGQDLEISMPDSLLQQETIDIIVNIRTILQELLGA